VAEVAEGALDVPGLVRHAGEVEQERNAVRPVPRGLVEACAGFHVFARLLPQESEALQVVGGGVSAAAQVLEQAHRQVLAAVRNEDAQRRPHVQLVETPRARSLSAAASASARSPWPAWAARRTASAAGRSRSAGASWESSPSERENSPIDRSRAALWKRASACVES
jgi:hypothetical protein